MDNKEFNEKIKEAVNNPEEGRNSMGCREANYNVYFMIGNALDEEELSNLTENEIKLLLKLAEYASDAFY